MSTTSHGVALAGLLSAACAGLAGPAAAAAGDYPYALTAQSAARCAALQSRIGALMPEGSDERRFHAAMAATWKGVAAKQPGGAPAIAAANDAVAAGQPVGQLREALKPCAVMRAIHGEQYFGMADELAQGAPDLFAGKAAMQSQTGLPAPDLPKKALTFGAWTFEARGNSCIAERKLAKGAVLRLGFTNFMDGGITLTDPGLPRFGDSDEAWERDEAAHRAGADSDPDSYAPMMADGVSYASYPGTALFVDGRLAAGFHEYLEESDPPQYRLGALQDKYYSLLAEGKTATVKVLGKEKHKFALNDAAGFWIEMSNCVAQYPNG